MSKQQYLRELESALRAKKVMDIEDILREYAQHFTLKMADGFSETEIADKLEKPSAIAEQFSESERPGASKKGGGKMVLAIGLVAACILRSPRFHKSGAEPSAC